VHVHGWTFFLWYLLLPLQAILIATKRIPLHRTLGTASIVLAVAMVATGLVVIGVQMEAARQPNGNPFWIFLGPTIFVTLVLFAAFFALAFKFRKNRDLHKRFIVLASAGALGAAGFRVIGRIIGFGPAAGISGIFAPNLFIVIAILLDMRAGKGFHKVYRWGLPISFLAEAGTMLLTPTAAGQLLSRSLAWLGRLLATLY
jgi:uncharacterized membrane protein YozB (DUF420 family)